MSDDIELEDSETLPSEEDVKTEDVEDTDAESGTEDSQPEYTENEKKLYARAKKAEAEAKALKAKLSQPQSSEKKPSPPPSGDGSLTVSVREFKAISDLEDEDAEYVANYAEKFGMTLADARKNKDVKAVLAVRAEERRTAAATSTGPARRGTSKVSDEALLEKASRGEIPEDEDSLMRIAAARLKKRGS